MADDGYGHGPSRGRVVAARGRANGPSENNGLREWAESRIQVVERGGVVCHEITQPLETYVYLFPLRCLPTLFAVVRDMVVHPRGGVLVKLVIPEYAICRESLQDDDIML